MLPAVEVIANCHQFRPRRVRWATYRCMVQPEWLVGIGGVAVVGGGVTLAEFDRRADEAHDGAFDLLAGRADVHDGEIGGHVRDELADHFRVLDGIIGSEFAAGAALDHDTVQWCPGDFVPSVDHFGVFRPKDTELFGIG